MGLIEVNWAPGPRTLRKFGLACVVAFGALGAWVFFGQSIFAVRVSPEAARIAAGVLWAIAGAGGALGIAAPTRLRWPYVVLTAVTLPVGFLVSHTALAVVYYGVITPIGLVFRLVGRDSLHRTFDRSAASYWVRRPETTDVKRYFRQF